jgi:hypothetical protein
MAGCAENPFSALLGLMREQGAHDNPPSWGMGEVAQLAPLKVRFGGIVLEPEQLFWLNGFSDSQLQVGSQVAVLPDQAFSMFLILGERVV